MEGESKNEIGEKPGPAELGKKYLVRVGMQPDFASIEIIPPLRADHREALTNNLGQEDAPQFIDDEEEEKSVHWMEPSEPLSSQIHEFETQEAEIRELAEREAVERGKEIGGALASIAGVRVEYGPIISAHSEKEKELIAA